MSFLWRDVAPFVSETQSRAVAPLSPAMPLSMPLGRRGLLAGLALGAALAVSARSMRPAQAADGDAEGARKFVAEVAAKAIALMADRALAEAARMQQFHDLFVASFDLPAIGQQVLGRYWKIASPDQQAQFLRLFEQQQLLTWAARFKSYDGQVVTAQSAAADADGGWRVSSQVDRPGGNAPIALDWRVTAANGAWHIVDLAIQGASLARTLHQDYASVIEANGGKIDSLLAALQKKIAELGPA
jgi:phospholipid transport system substrate-binding protein